MDKAEYIDKVTSIFSDRTKFECILDNQYKLVLRLKEKLNGVLWFIREYILAIKKICDFVRASCSIPGTMHGLVKTQKGGYPTGPIVSAIKTFIYNLYTFLVSILAPFTCNQIAISNSANFHDHL